MKVIAPTCIVILFCAIAWQLLLIGENLAERQLTIDKLTIQCLDHNPDYRLDKCKFLSRKQYWNEKDKEENWP